MHNGSGVPSEDCRELFARLSEYLDGELTPEAQRQIEAHLCDCPPCVEFINSLRSTVDLCRHLQPSEPAGHMSAEAKQHLLAAFRRALAGRGGKPSQ